MEEKNLIEHLTAFGLTRQEAFVLGQAMVMRLPSVLEFPDLMFTRHWMDWQTKEELM